MTSEFMKVTLGHLKIIFFCDLFLCNTESFKTFPECQHYEDANFSLNARSYNTTIIRSSPYVYGPILMKSMNSNIMKTQFFHKLYNVTFMLLRSFVIFYFKTF